MRTYAELETYLRDPKRTLRELCEEHAEYYEGTGYHILGVKRTQDLLDPSPCEYVEVRLDGESDQGFNDLDSARAYIIQDTLDQAVHCLD